MDSEAEQRRVKQMISIERIEKDKQTWELNVTVNGATEAQIAEASALCSKLYAVKLENGKTKTVYTKKNIANFEAELKAVFPEVEEAEEVEEVATTPVATATKKPARRVVTLSYAQSMKMNHGKAWMPTQHQIDTGVVPCGYEGELVCYVYEG